MNIGATELAIIFIILLLLFGAKQLPKLARSFGEAAKEMRDGLAGKKKSETSEKKDSKKE